MEVLSGVQLVNCGWLREKVSVGGEVMESLVSLESYGPELQKYLLRKKYPVILEVGGAQSHGVSIVMQCCRLY